MQNSKLNKLIKVALLAALAYMLMFLELALPIFPSFLKLDISDLPAIISALAMGPLYGVAVELIKNLLHLMQTSSGGIGELANFIVGSALIIPAGLIYGKNHTKLGAAIGLAVGVVCMAIAGGLANYFILIPFYQSFMPIEAIVAMAAEVNGAVTNLFTLVLFAIVPFNLFKGTIIAVLTLLLYKRVSPLLTGRVKG